MLGGIDIQPGVVILALLLLLAPLMLATLILLYGKKLGKFQKPIAAAILFFGYVILTINW